MDEATVQPDSLPQEPEAPKKSVAFLSFISLGIVFGDIGTSPLYTFKAIFSPTPLGIEASMANVLGILSLIFWALMLVITLKYVTVVMRAQYEGEGGIFSMLALLKKNPGVMESRWKKWMVMLAAMLGAALLFGDGVITPAISVVSAVEGMELVSSNLSHLIVPISVIILLGLYLWQRMGINKIALFFSPIMLLWFICIGIFGLLQIMAEPEVLKAINPWWAITFFASEPFKAFFLLSLVVLCVTGGEALYADLGQFGRKAISLAWFGIVWPCLLLNYFGQGAWLFEASRHSGGWIHQLKNLDATHPFFSIIPDTFLWPMIILATLAAIIASQAIITGAFAITRQAMQLRLLPYLRVIHTSQENMSHVYLPAMNRFMLVGSIAAVVIFMSSDRLAAAYGVAVTAVMVTTTILLFFVARVVWKWPIWTVFPLVCFFLIIDLAFFGANILKVPDGGWFPLVIALIFMILMTTWQKGRREVLRRHPEEPVKIDAFIEYALQHDPIRIEGTAVFLTAYSDTTPTCMVGLYRHLPVLYKNSIIISMQPSHIAQLPRSRQLEVQEIGNGFWLLIGHYGYLQAPNVPRLLQLARNQGLEVDLQTVTYFTRREIIVPGGPSHMMGWRKGLFAAMSRNAMAMSNVFELPTDRVIEIGIRVDI